MFVVILIYLHSTTAKCGIFNVLPDYADPKINHYTTLMGPTFKD